MLKLIIILNTLLNSLILQHNDNIVLRNTTINNLQWNVDNVTLTIKDTVYINSQININGKNGKLIIEEGGVLILKDWLELQNNYSEIIVNGTFIIKGGAQINKESLIKVCEKLLVPIFNVNKGYIEICDCGEVIIEHLDMNTPNPFIHKGIK